MQVTKKLKSGARERVLFLHAKDQDSIIRTIYGPTSSAWTVPEY